MNPPPPNRLFFRNSTGSSQNCNGRKKSKRDFEYAFWGKEFYEVAIFICQVKILKFKMAFYFAKLGRFGLMKLFITGFCLLSAYFMQKKVQDGTSKMAANSAKLWP